MDQFDFTSYCLTFIEDQHLGDLPFFKDEEQIITYRQLVTLSLSLREEMIKIPSEKILLVIHSPFFFFAHLLAAIFSNKKAIILSTKEPSGTIDVYKKRFGVNEVVRGLIGSYKNFDQLPAFLISSNTHAFSILSSGSTGVPKDIKITLSNVYNSARGIIDQLEMKQSETSFMNLPHHHIGGMMILWRTFFSRGQITTDDNQNYDYLSVVPLQLKRALSDEKRIEKLKKCRAILVGGAPFDQRLKEEATLAGLPIFETYGMTETTSLVLLNGKPLYGQTIKLGVDGHFLVKGPTLSSSVSTDSEGFYHTKDLGRINTDGSFSFVRRTDLLFKSGGELINPLVTEEKIKELSWVIDAIAVPIKHYQWTLAQALVYRINDNSRSKENIKEEIKNHLKSTLHPHHIPRYFYEADESILSTDVKPKRFEISRYATEKYFSEMINYHEILGQDPKKYIIFFHGFMEDLTDLTPLVDLGEHYSALFIDLPGHGKTSTSNFNSREEVFFILSELIKFKAQDLPYTLYGYSMGGRVALELALDHLRPEALILESAHLGMETTEQKKERMDFDRNLFKNVDDLRLFFKDWYKNPIFKSYDQSPNFEKDIEKKLSHPKEEWQKSLEYFSPGISPHLYSSIKERLREMKIYAISGVFDTKYSNHYRKVTRRLKA